MDRDVERDTRPGRASQETEATSTVGKSTLSGRLGGEHGRLVGGPPEPGAASSAAPKTPGDPKAAAPDKPAGAAKALTITTNTEAKAPAAANTRTTVAVGEVVTFTGSEEGDWTTTGGNTLSDTKTNSFRWGAGAKPGSYTITLKVDDRTASKTIVVLAPSAIYFHKASDMSFSGQGVGMTLNMDIGPKNVSFGAVQVREKPGGASGVWGYFANKQKTGADLSHSPKATPTWVNEDNTLSSPDDAFFDGWPGPYTPGGMTWVIPNLWSMIDGSGGETQFATVTQNMHIADTKGTSVVTKGGQSASRRG